MENLPSQPGDCGRYAAQSNMDRLVLRYGDITRLNVDAIVNAANESLLGGGGVDGAIQEAAGPKLVAASRLLAPCHAGNAVMTPGFNLRARHVIHAVGPVYLDGTSNEPDTLRRTYLSSLRIAEQNKLLTIAFPCISTGAYGFPSPSACEIAIQAVTQWQREHIHPNGVTFCCYNQSDFDLYETRLDDLGIAFKIVD